MPPAPTGESCAAIVDTLQIIRKKPKRSSIHTKHRPVEGGGEAHVVVDGELACRHVVAVVQQRAGLAHNVHAVDHRATEKCGYVLVRQHILIVGNIRDLRARAAV